MVKLPGEGLNRFDSRVATPNAKLVDKSAQVRQVGRAATDMLSTVANVSSDIFYEEKKRKDASDALTAEKIYNQEKIKAQEALDRDIDYESHPLKFQAMTDTGIERALGNVMNPTLKQKLKEKFIMDRDGMASRVHANMEKGLDDRFMAQTEETLVEKLKIIGTESATPDQIRGAISEVREDIRQLRAAGRITAVQEGRMLRKFVNDAAVTYTKQLDPDTAEQDIDEYIAKRKSGEIKRWQMGVPEDGDTNVRISSGGKMPVVKSTSGANFQVHSRYADRFAGLVNDLEALGLKIDPRSSGGFANRNIDGTSKPSNHAFGAAIDINWNANARGRRGQIRDVIPEEKIREVAKKWGMKWGGDWKNPDDMHFEIDRGAKEFATFDPNKISEAKANAEAAGIPTQMSPRLAEMDSVYGGLSDVELGELKKQVQQQKRQQNLARYAEDEESANGLITWLESGKALTPEQEAKVDELRARYKSLGPNYEQRWGKIESKIQTAKHFQEYMQIEGEDGKPVSSDHLPTPVVEEHIGQQRLQLAKDRRAGKIDDAEFSRRNNALNMLMQRAAKREEMRAKDPAKSVEDDPTVMQSSEDLMELEQEVEGSEGPVPEARLRFMRREALTAKLEAQIKQGIPENRTSYVTKAQAKQILPVDRLHQTNETFEGLVQKAYAEQLQALGDKGMAARVVADAYRLVAPNSGDDRTTYFATALEDSLRTGVPPSRKAIEQLNKVADGAGQINFKGQTRPRPRAYVLPSEKAQQHLRENVDNGKLVKKFAELHGPEAVVRILAGETLKEEAAKVEPEKAPGAGLTEAQRSSARQGISDTFSDMRSRLNSGYFDRGF